MAKLFYYIKYHFAQFSWPVSVGIIDIIQILLIAVFVYYLMLWVKNTRAYTLLKGILLVAAFLLVAFILRMNTILWICKQFSVVAITGVIVIFQPELRRVLEQLGEKGMISSFFPFDTGKDDEGKISDRTIGELVHAVFAMSEVKTGALIVVEQQVILSEYEKTGIAIDAEISSQLLINIFEHNTPLHDGAVIIRENRVVAATCYLPLSDNLELNKSLGTRHRAGVGISEVSDAFTIIVSEETGNVSYTLNGKLHAAVPPSVLREELCKMQQKNSVKEESSRFKILKGRGKNERKDSE